MKAVFNTARGTARDTLALKEVDLPSPGAGEVLVAMRASGVNPSDVKLRSGAQGPMIADQVLVHNDGAGVIEAVGEGVGPARVGQRVWMYNINRSADGLGQGPLGTATQYAIIPAHLAVELPEEASFEAGACLGVPAMTAHRALMWAGPVAGRTVLVTGGAGAVGHSAIQIAKAKGARVIATVSNDIKAEIAREAGADEVLNYKATPLLDQLLDLVGNGGIDHVVDVDIAAHMEIYPQILKINGSVGAYASASNLTPALPFYPLAFRNIQLQPVFVYSMSDAAKAEAIKDINALLTSGQLLPRIDRRFALEDIAGAHETVEEGSLLGNAVVTL
ncbi:NADPH:quinone reductase [Tritonibacter scottomollicae]|uniref:NADPH2:quinone reductase n=1 Tax=Tritonibacter scottomollicae TaxID=483013 RepID=A0A2T1AP86_TRISK|nr:NADPH:quinone reductase [Tritonibacter scottomollicae]PRZ50416.1 NADPH2:quinone reductase [Tritonibacter scottomollicae]